MVLLVAATAYLVGLWPALALAAVAAAADSIRRVLAAEQRRRMELFRDRWSHRFHCDYFAAAPAMAAERPERPTGRAAGRLTAPRGSLLS